MVWSFVERLCVLGTVWYNQCIPSFFSSFSIGKKVESDLAGNEDTPHLCVSCYYELVVEAYEFKGEKA